MVGRPGPSHSSPRYQAGCSEVLVSRSVAEASAKGWSARFTTRVTRRRAPSATSRPAAVPGSSRKATTSPVAATAKSAVTAAAVRTRRVRALATMSD